MQDNEKSKEESARKNSSVSRFRFYLFASFLGNLVAPIFSLFLPVLAVDIGATVFEVGLVGGAENCVYAFMPFVMGHFTDKGRSRQFFILSGFGILTCVSAFYLIAWNPVALIIARLFEGLGWAMLWPAIESSITIETFGNSGKALSLFNSSWSLGAAVGPLVGGVLIVLGSNRTAYAATSIMLGAVLLVNIFSTMRQDKKTQNATRNNNNTRRNHYSLAASVKQIFQRGDESKNFQVRLYVASLILSYFAVGILYTFFGPYAKTLGMSALLFSLPVVLFGLIRFLIYLLSTKEQLRVKLLNQKNRNKILVSFLFIACASPLLILIRDPSGAIYFLAFGLFAAGLSMVYFVSQVGMIAESGEGQMGAGAGVFESVIGLGSAAGPIIAGSIASGSYTVPFIVPIVAFFLVMLLFAIDAKRRKLF